jgi:hypothetical protein
LGKGQSMTYNLKDGDELEVGDYIVGKTPYGTNIYPITRVTTNYAFSYIGETYEAKFRRKYYKYSCSPLPRYKWSQVDYIAYRYGKEETV